MFSFSFFAKPAVALARNITVVTSMADALLKNNTQSGGHHHEGDWLFGLALGSIIVMALAGISATCYYERKKLCPSAKPQEEKEFEMKPMDLEFGDLDPDAEYKLLHDDEKFQFRGVYTPSAY